ncbi:MAG: YbhB/YbcL family Raf kinase inhibitor-like protein [Malacoplasma sp.]|nr:YbhB/YbcL family Raf kinase inhibitor-like protein [Malacoplasma sp.]
MKVFSKNILENGYIGDEFGQNSKDSSSYFNGKVVKSIHVGWKDVPLETKTLAIFCIDFDSIPVCGFPFLHWAVANIDPSWNELKENASFELKDKLIQGQNSTCSPFFNEEKKVKISEDTALFIGCGPPDRDHTYTLNLYAVNKFLNLKNGFFVNALIKELKGNIIDKATLTFNYKKIV